MGCRRATLLRYSFLLTDVLTDDLIVTLSHELASLTPQQIVQLGMSLGYTAAETTEELSLHTTVQEFILFMLQTWKKGYSLPIRERLSKALAKCGYLTHVSEVHSIGKVTLGTKPRWLEID